MQDCKKKFRSIACLLLKLCELKKWLMEKERNILEIKFQLTAAVVNIESWFDKDEDINDVFTSSDEESYSESEEQILHATCYSMLEKLDDIENPESGNFFSNSSNSLFGLDDVEIEILYCLTRDEENQNLIPSCLFSRNLLAL